MSKRFTDTEKYKKPFIRSLRGPYKLLWDYLYHDCDNAGIWIVDFEIAQIYIGVDMPVNCADALRVFNSDQYRVHPFDDGKKWFIPSFISFQYNELSETNPAHKRVISTLTGLNFLKNGVVPLEDLQRTFVVPSQGTKDKDKVVGKVVEMGMDKEKAREKKDNSDAEAAGIIQYLNDVAGKSFRTDNKAFLAAIQARLVESTAERLKEVIELKTVQWKEDAKMEKYLIPSTLFAKSNFWKYLGEVDDAKARGLTRDQIKGVKKGLNEGLAEGVAAIYRARAERERSDNLRAANAQEG